MQKKDQNRKEAPIIVQVLIFSLICCLGNLLAEIVPLNCSAPIYDFLITYLMLQFNIIHLEWIEKISNILAGCMLLAFVPGTVAIITEMDQFLKLFLPAFLASTIVSMLVLLVSGWTVQFTTRIFKKLQQEGAKK